MTSSWHSYPKVFALGHPQVRDIFSGPVVIESKCDGSQFSFGVHNGELKCRSKNREFSPDAPDKMFTIACEQIKGREHMFREGWTYRAEYLKSPKHNALAYDRVPYGNLVIFDVEVGLCEFLDPDQKRIEADRLGFEPIKSLFSGIWDKGADELRDFLTMTDQLGGQTLEGVVIKNYSMFGRDGKVLMGKYVSEAFKEVHKHDWKERHPGQKDIISQIIDAYKTPARWNKAIMHLKELDKLIGEPKDIGPLMKELSEDITSECTEEIKDMLWNWAKKDILRGVGRGFPEYYKNKLLEEQFER